jgi:hypothetical protein
MFVLSLPLCNGVLDTCAAYIELNDEFGNVEETFSGLFEDTFFSQNFKR